MSFDISGHTVTLGALILAAVAFQWLVFAIASAFSRQPKPKTGLRPPERRLVISSAVMAVAWLAVFGPALRPRSSTTLTSAITTRTKGSCSQVKTDMAADKVREIVGKPDEIRPDDETRGPGAAIWI